jgi:hypothetical protein
VRFNAPVMMQAAEKAGNDEIKILNIYFLEIGPQVIITSSEECSSERYFGVLRNVILGYFGILHNVIWEFFRTLFWSSLERHFGVLRNVILEFFRTLFGSSSERYLEVLRNVIWKFFGTLFGSSSEHYLEVLRNNVLKVPRNIAVGVSSEFCFGYVLGALSWRF